jgi:hypothetical protein
MRAVRVVRERFDDVLLLLVAVAIALVIRGIPRHQIIGGLEDAGWAALAVALYLPIVFVVGAVAAALSLSRGDVSLTSIVQGVTLNLSRVAGGIIPCEGRCVIRCSDGSEHSSVACGVKKFDSGRDGVLVIAAGFRLGVVLRCVPASVLPRRRARPRWW